MTFESTRSQFLQQHITVVEIDLPGVSGSGFGTPITELTASDITNTYKFTLTNSPTLPESNIFKIVTSITENPAKLKPQSGLAVRGSGTINLIDIKGDPNIGSPSVTTQVKGQGTFLAKLNARNILTNKPLRIKNYRVSADGTIDLSDANAEIRYYIIESFDNVGQQKWQIKFKDELSRLNLEESVFPEQKSIQLTGAASSTQTQFFVNDVSDLAVDQTVRIGDELMKVATVGANFFSIAVRGADITYTNTLSTTVASAHNQDDEVFICDVMDDENIADFLERVLLAIGVDAARIPKSNWTTEVNTWHSANKLNGLWIESHDAYDVIEQVLTDYFIDLWYDPVAREIKLAAISQWQQSVTDNPLIEGNQIDYGTVQRKHEEKLRYTRALVLYDKPNKVDSDDVENYRKASLYTKTDQETSDYYGEPKTKRFDHSPILSKSAASLLVGRYVERYTNPIAYTWITSERKLTFDIGDVVDVQTDADTGFSGVTEANRAQIQTIKPLYRKEGRVYQVKALTYNPEATSGSEYVITGTLYDLNVWNYVGEPPDAVDVIIILDGAKIGASDDMTAIKAGSFASGSKITFILVNGADVRSKGGTGGTGGSADPEGITFSPTPGGDGGICYDAQGVTTDIYFSGDYSAVSSYDAGGGSTQADGFIRAPCGGDGGFEVQSISLLIPGDGGDGGIGFEGGDPGKGGFLGPTIGNDGNRGQSIDVFAQNGNANNGGAGGPGSGVIDNGATVTFYGSTSARYINGNGDH